MGDLPRAESLLTLLRGDMARVPAENVLHNNTCSNLLAVALAMLEGEIAYRGGRFDTAFARLEDAVELSDKLVYDEPWGWMQPPRHALGALLLEQVSGFL